MIPRLSPREQAVLVRIRDDHVNKQIAADLGITEQTVKNHVSSILVKLDVHTRTAAVMRAVRLGILPLDGPTREAGEILNELAEARGLLDALLDSVSEGLRLLAAEAGPFQRASDIDAMAIGQDVAGRAIPAPTPSSRSAA